MPARAINRPVTRYGSESESTMHKATITVTGDALTDALAGAVEAFRDTDATFRQGVAIDALQSAGLAVKEIPAAIAEARVRDRFRADMWSPATDGTGPQSYREMVEVTARLAHFTQGSTLPSVEKHRASWSLITDAGVSHRSAEAYGDAWAIARAGGISAAKREAVRIAALAAEEREAALRTLADRLVPTRAAKTAEGKAKAEAKRAEAKAKAEATEARLAGMTAAERVLGALAAVIAAEDVEGALSAEDFAAIAAGLAAEAKRAEAKGAERVARV